MGRTFIRQETQIRNSDSYDDTLSAGSTLESGPANIQDDLNGVRSQLKRAIWADSAGNWWDDIPTVNAKKRGIQALNTDLDELESQKILRRITLLTDIAVPASQNYKILSVASSEAPSEVAAVSAGTEGAVVAQSALNGGAYAANELTEITGQNAVDPKNLCLVRNASTGEIIESSGREVFALLQYESTGGDGLAFNDTSAGRRAKLSFVRQNATFDDLEACPVADIESLSINYAYVARTNFDSLPEQAWITQSGFVDMSQSVTVSLDYAVDNQSGAVTQTGKHIEWRVDDTYKLAFQDSTGAADIFAVKPAAGGDEVEFNGAFVDINNTSPVDILSSLKVDTGGTEIDIGVTAGLIGTTSSADLRVLGAGELYLDDGNQAGSSWAQTNGIKLSDTTAEWSDLETVFGAEVSILKALALSRRRSPVYAELTGTVGADTDVGGAAGGANLNAQLPDMSVGSFLNDYDVYLNGKKLRPGANSAANNDYYPGTSLANGQLKFEFTLKINDVICVVPYIR